MLFKTDHGLTRDRQAIIDLQPRVFATSEKIDDETWVRRDVQPIIEGLLHAHGAPASFLRFPNAQLDVKRVGRGAVCVRSIHCNVTEILLAIFGPGLRIKLCDGHHFWSDLPILARHPSPMLLDPQRIITIPAVSD